MIFTKKKLTNGEDKPLKSIPPFWIWVIGIGLTGLVGYYTSQISIAAQLADRPTRQEVENNRDADRKEVKESLKDIKDQQKDINGKIDRLSDSLYKYLIEAAGKKGR